MTRFHAFAAALILSLILPIFPALAEAKLERSAPLPGSAQNMKLSEVRLWFGAALAAGSVAIDVYDECGNHVDQRNTAIDPADRKQARITVEPSNPGTYEVHWKVTAEDKTETKGAFKFTVAQ